MFLGKLVKYTNENFCQIKLSMSSVALKNE